MLLAHNGEGGSTIVFPLVVSASVAFSVLLALSGLVGCLVVRVWYSIGTVVGLPRLPSQL